MKRLSSQTLIVKANEHQPRLIKCSPIDTLLSNVPVSLCFIYQKNIPPEVLITSLGIVLKDFPNFAGRLVKRDEELYIDCNNQGVQLKIVHVDQTIFPCADLTKLTDSKLVNVIHPGKALKYQQPLLLIQLTYYQDALIIGYSFHHVLGDIVTLMEFLKALSLAAQGEPYPLPMLLEDPGAHLEQVVPKDKKLKECKVKSFSYYELFQLAIQRILPKKKVLLMFTDEEILALREAISTKAGQKLSRFEALCAYLFDLLNCSRGSETSYLSLFINIRKPLGLSSNLLGNFIDIISIMIKKPHDVASVAVEINQAIKNYKENFQYYEVKDFVLKQGLNKLRTSALKIFSPEYNNVLFNNLLNRNTYAIDFGIATPYLFSILDAVFPWTGFIAEGINNKGILVGLLLPSSAAKKFTSPEMLKKIHHYQGK